MIGRSAVGDSKTSSANWKCRAVGGLADQGGLEAEANVRLELLSRRTDFDAAGDRDGVEGRGVQRTLGHEREDSAVLLEPSVDLGFDGHVAGRIDDAVLVEGDLDPGVERDIGLGVSGQRGDDTQRLMRLERPRIEGPAIVRGEREAVDRAGRERLIWSDANRPSIGIGLDRELDLGLTVRRRANSAAGVAFRLASRKLLPSPTTPAVASSAVSSATGVQALAARRTPGATVGIGASADPEADGPGVGPPCARPLSGSERQTSMVPTSATMTAAVPAIATGLR